MRSWLCLGGNVGSRSLTWGVILSMDTLRHVRQGARAELELELWHSPALRLGSGAARGVWCVAGLPVDECGRKALTDGGNETGDWQAPGCAGTDSVCQPHSKADGHKLDESADKHFSRTGEMCKRAGKKRNATPRRHRREESRSTRGASPNLNNGSLRQSKVKHPFVHVSWSCI